jgi:hypothetical protein
VNITRQSNGEIDRSNGAGRKTSKQQKNMLLDSDSGVRLRITPAGAKSWIVLRRIKGRKPVLITLGKYPALSLAEARKLARKTISEMASGVDPRQRIKAEGVAAMTVAEALEGYLTLRCSQLKPSTIASYRAAMRSELKPIADQPIKTLTSEMDGIRVLRHGPMPTGQPDY